MYAFLFYESFLKYLGTNISKKKKNVLDAIGIYNLINKTVGILLLIILKYRIVYTTPVDYWLLIIVHKVIQNISSSDYRVWCTNC